MTWARPCSLTMKSWVAAGDRSPRATLHQSLLAVFREDKAICSVQLPKLLAAVSCNFLVCNVTQLHTIFVNRKPILSDCASKIPVLGDAVETNSHRPRWYSKVREETYRRYANSGVRLACHLWMKRKRWRSSIRPRKTCIYRLYRSCVSTDI